MKYDYDKQAFIDEQGRYVPCNHPPVGTITEWGEPFEGCDCYGTLHAGELAVAS